MPIYEYSCPRCGANGAIFKTGIAEAEAALAELACSRCQSHPLKRRISRVNQPKVTPGKGETLYEFDRLTADIDRD